MPLLQYNDDDDNDGLTQEWRPQMYTGPWPNPTQPNIQQTQPKPTHEYLGRRRPDLTLPKPKAVLQLSKVINMYFKCWLLFYMHVKIKPNMQHKY